MPLNVFISKWGRILTINKYASAPVKTGLWGSRKKAAVMNYNRGIELWDIAAFMYCMYHNDWGNLDYWYAWFAKKFLERENHTKNNDQTVP